MGLSRSPERNRLIEQTLLDTSVGVDAAVAEKGPMGAVFGHAFPFHVGEDDFFAIDARLGEYLAARRDDEALAPEFDSIATGRRLVADPIDRRDKTPIRDRMAALHCFPGRMLDVAVFRFL